MANFSEILIEVEKGRAKNPFSTKFNGEWGEGTISVDFLNNNFGPYSNATEMKSNTNSEGLKLFFDYLVSQGKLTQ